MRTTPNRAAAVRRYRLAGGLRREGALRDHAWIDVFRTVPRHVFLPRFFVQTGPHWAAVDYRDEGWLDHVYTDKVLVTQLDDDPGRWRAARAAGPVDGVPTCSSSMPSIMAIMLEELNVLPGQRILEIGTGTGYNAALLCERVGEHNVSTVDIDPTLTEGAAQCLDLSGHHPRCVTADGFLGLPDSTPYQRILCTCSVSAIPPAWLEQTEPGGLIVTTLNRPIGAGLVRITAGEGATGHGKVLVRDGRFMPMRAHRRADPADLIDTVDDATTERRTALSMRTVLSPAARFDFFAGLAIPGVAPIYELERNDATFLVHADGSWAHHVPDGDAFLVAQGGPRKLWDAVEEAYAWWLELDKPGRGEFGVSIDGDRQEFWLRDPSGPRWPIA